MIDTVLKFKSESTLALVHGMLQPCKHVGIPVNTKRDKQK
jgi:hypothetical protein